MNREDKKVYKVEDGVEESPTDSVSRSRRDAVAKLAYATPVVAGLLFSKSSAAMQSPVNPFLPPPPPGG